MITKSNTNQLGRGLLTTIVAVVLLHAALGSAQSQQCPGTTNVVKFFLPPQTQLGYDIYDGKGVALADDFYCNVTGPITDIHIWTSWLNNQVDVITNFWLGIYNDIPGVTNASDQVVTPSSPGTNLLWSQFFSQSQFSSVLFTANADEYFFDARNNNVIIGGDSQVYVYCFSPTNPFVQQGTAALPTNYWLAVHAGLLNPTNFSFGWKTCISNYNDAAVWVPASGGMPVPGAPWIPIYDPMHTNQALGLSFLLATPSNAPVTCVETDQVKYVQGPNLNSGFDVWNSSSKPPGVGDGPWVLADDFVCTNTGPITDIHLWGSWFNDAPLPGSITFWLGVYDDVPASPTNSNSHPGNLLWQQYFAPGQYAEMPFTSGQEHFLDPGPPANLGPESQVWYYCFYPNSLVQTGLVTNPKIYWLAAYAQLPAGTTQVYGWKTTTNVQHDISVHEPWPGFGPPNNAGWIPTLQSAAGGPLDLAFKIDTATNQCGLTINCPTPSKTVECGSNWVFDPPTATNPCCPVAPSITFEGVFTNSSAPCQQVYTATWLITDCFSDRGICTQQVTVVDTTPPSLTLSTNIVVYSCSNVVVSWPVFATDTCSSVTVTSTPPSGSTFGPNTTTTVTVTATDACGNTTNGTFTVMVDCTQTNPPVTCIETNGVKYVQWPNLFGGFDVWNSSVHPPGDTNTPWVLADDFVCTNTGPITDIHIWGSWLADQVLTNSITFWLGVYDDVPVGPNNPFSHPGTNLVWQQYFVPGQYAEEFYANGQENFLDPGPPVVVGPDSQVWYYCFYPSNLVQTGSVTFPKIYWLAAYAQLPAGIANVYGWKTTTNVQHDVSVHAPWPGVGPNFNPGWVPTYQPIGPAPTPVDLAFKIDTSTNTPPPTLCVETDAVKYVQGPLSYGGYDVWDSSARPPAATDGPWVLADDFVCTNTGPISDIHIWGSWLYDDALPNSITFWLGIYSDVPANATNVYSHPGNLLWQQYFSPGQYAELIYGPGQEGFLDPGPPANVGADSQVWYYCFYPTNLFQTGTTAAPKIYWLSVFAQLPPGVTNVFGWKTTTNVQHDISVHAQWPGVTPPNPPWIPNMLPTGQPLDLAFKLSTVTNQCGLTINCPMSKTVQCGSSWGFDPPTATNPCCPTPATITFEGEFTNSSTPCQQVYTATWLITDCSGDRGICTQQVTVVDTTPPSLTVPTNFIVYTCTTNAIVTWSVTATDVCSSVTVTSSPPSPASFLPDTTNTVSVTAVDACGNTTNKTFTVAVERPVLGNLTIMYETNHTVILTWSNGILEMATNVLGPYTDVGGATSPYTNTTSLPTKFYRLRCLTP